MTKTEIIAAAYRAWGRELYLTTSLSDVARELKVCKPALYRHFLCKDALLEAMGRQFFDHFAAFIQADYEKALKNNDAGESIFMLIRSIAEYYVRNPDLFIYSMTKLHDRRLNNFAMMEELCVRGIDFEYFHKSISASYYFEPLVMRLIFATLTFFMAGFHKERAHAKNPPDETAVSGIIGAIERITGGGIGYGSAEIEGLDFERLESRIAGTAGAIEDDPLLKAVAGAVAETGPWEASMEQVARRSGLAKSSLYGHFKSKQDMLFQLFRTESLRIIGFAKQGIQQSDAPLEQLYLCIFSIAEYLRSRPDFLVALDWIRNRRLNFAPPGSAAKGPPVEYLQIFQGIDIKPLQKDDSPFRGLGPQDEAENSCISPWICFLTVKTLMNTKPEQALGDVPNSHIRTLYRFATTGIGGFKIK